MLSPGYSTYINKTFLFCSSGVRTQSLVVARQALYPLNHPPSPSNTNLKWKQNHLCILSCNLPLHKLFFNLTTTWLSFLLWYIYLSLPTTTYKLYKSMEFCICLVVLRFELRVSHLLYDLIHSVSPWGHGFWLVFTVVFLVLRIIPDIALFENECIYISSFKKVTSITLSL
jgi:hypothetical protein